MPFFFYFDWTYILVIIGVIICGICAGIMNSTFNKYSKVKSHSGFNGARTADSILQNAGIYNVNIGAIDGKLTDHYDPSSKYLRLSASVYSQTSIASIGVAAHECGHAIQDNKGYMPLVIRTAIVPVVNICSKASWLLIVLGLVLSGTLDLTYRSGYVNIASMILIIGIVLFSATVIFQLITLPVEIDASRRGLKALKTLGILSPDELIGAKKVLTAAAFTYVASAISAILSLIRIILIAKRND